MNASALCLLLVVAGAMSLGSATPDPKTTTPRHQTAAPTTTHSLPTTAPKMTHSHPTIAPKTTHSEPTTAPKTTHSHPTTAPNTTHSHPTTAAKTTHSHPTTAPKTTHSHPTTAPNTTHSHPTTAPKTTHSHPTTAPKTTHSHPTTAPNTTHSHPTTAPNTTHSHPTTAPNTTHSEPTTISETTPRVPKTTAHHTPGNTTKNPAHTTAAAGNTTSNATGSTVRTTTPAGTTIPRPENVIPSYQVKNGSDQVCMLFIFNATLKIKYETTDNETGVATIPVGGNINRTGIEWTFDAYCEEELMRFFRLSGSFAVPNSNATGYVSLVFQFGITFLDMQHYGLGLLTASWSYLEPFFPRNVKNYGGNDWGGYTQVYTGTTGKTFGCQTLYLTNPKKNVTIILDHVMLQPYANRANGSFGDVEECKTNPTTMEPATSNATMATKAHPPTKPSPNNGGMIAGIVIGVLAFVVLIIGIAVFVVRKRRMKEAAYGHLDEEHKDYVH